VREHDDDYRPLPLHDRKERLARLVDRRLTAIVMNEHTDAADELCPGRPAAWAWKASCRSG
jgi:hypothetical protein